MFLSSRAASVPDLGAVQVTRALVHTSFRAHVVQNRSIVADDALFLRGFPRLGCLGRSVVTVVLRGRARLHTGEQAVWLEPGHVAELSHKHRVSMRTEAQPCYESFVLEWDAGALGGAVRRFGHGALAMRDLERLRACAAELAAAPDPSSATKALAGALEVLAGQGIDLRLDRDLLAEKTPRRLRVTARALDRCLSELDAQPMLVDLAAELGVGERQVHRLVSELNERYGFNASNWRDTLVRRRVMVGANMMTAPGANTERVAKAVGYASPAAFCRALAQSRLPAPGAIAGVVAALC